MQKELDDAIARRQELMGRAAPKLRLAMKQVAGEFGLTPDELIRAGYAAVIRLQEESLFGRASEGK